MPNRPNIRRKKTKKQEVNEPKLNMPKVKKLRPSQLNSDMFKMREFLNPVVASSQTIEMSKINDPKNWGYKDEHHLIEERVAPASLQRLASLLQRPENRDIHDFAIKGTTFEDCIGLIAAKLDIALDGVYDVPDLAALLCSAIEQRGSGGHISEINSNLIPAAIVERDKTLSLEVDEGVIRPKTKEEIEVEEFSKFMKAQGCEVCSYKRACKHNNKCMKGEFGHA